MGDYINGAYTKEEPTFSDFRGDGDLAYPTLQHTDREAFDGRGFDDPLGGYYGPEEDDGGVDDYMEAGEEFDDDGEYWDEDDETTGAAYDEEGAVEEGEWVGPEPEAGEYYYEERRPVASAPSIAWKQRQLTLCIVGSMDEFNRDTSLASVQIEDELKGTPILKDLKKSTDFLGGIRVIKARNAFPVTIGVKASLKGRNGHEKIEGKLISKGQSDCLVFDMYPKASISTDQPEVIMCQPKKVRKPILAAYKNHEKVELRKYADPARLREGIANNPSSRVTKYVSATHPVMVEMEKDAKRRCAYLGKNYKRMVEFGRPHGGNYAIDFADVERQIEKLKKDYDGVNYVKDLPALTLTLARTQLSDPSAHRNQLRTNWRDSHEVGSELPATDDGERELERRLNTVHKIHITLEYDYLPQSQSSN